MLVTEVLYTPASTSIKFSILLLYRRLFPSEKLKIILLCIAGFLIVFALAQMVSVAIQCTPVAALWDPTSYPNATCDSYKSSVGIVCGRQCYHGFRHLVPAYANSLASTC